MFERRDLLNGHFGFLFGVRVYRGPADRVITEEREREELGIFRRHPCSLHLHRNNKAIISTGI